MSGEAGRQAPTTERGRIEERPFGPLLWSLARARRTVVLELERAGVRKRIELVHGVPAACHSNLIHETLTHYFVERGTLTSVQAQGYVAAAAARGVRVGELLLEDGLVLENELRAAVRRNLVHKVLECFTWTQGGWRLVPHVPSGAAPDDLDVPRLVYAGLSAYAPEAEARQALAAMIGRRLRLAEGAEAHLAGLPVQPPVRLRLTQLVRHPETEELLLAPELPAGAMLRALYACTVMGLVVGTDEPAPDAEPEVVLELDEIAAEPEHGAAGDEDARLCEQIQAEHVCLVGREPWEVLGVEPGADIETLRKRYVELVARYAPARFQAPGLTAAREAADALLSAVVRAWAALAETWPEPGGAEGPGGEAPALPPRPRAPRVGPAAPDDTAPMVENETDRGTPVAEPAPDAAATATPLAAASAAEDPASARPPAQAASGGEATTELHAACEQMARGERDAALASLRRGVACWARELGGPERAR